MTIEAVTVHADLGQDWFASCIMAILFAVVKDVIFPVRSGSERLIIRSFHRLFDASETGNSSFSCVVDVSNEN